MARRKPRGGKRPQAEAAVAPPVSSPALPARRPASPYIVSRHADRLLIVGAVLVCPLIILPLSRALSPRDVWMLVMTFGAIGHHFPSFLRTYGDRELFRRYRTRLLLAPPLLFAVALGFAVRGLHGVLLLSMCWSIWHGMMQNFGFLRIYDAKSATERRAPAQLDWWLCASWFAMCLVLSPNQAGSVLNALYDTGVPLIPPAAIAAIRIALIATVIAITALYVRQLIRTRTRPSWLKLGLLGGMLGYVWIARVMTHDPYLSVALFELLHDVQYLAIVWAFNRRLTVGGSGGNLARWLYQPRPIAVAGYVVACLSYGAIALVTFTQLDDGLLKQVLEAALVTSGLLHFYYDGFIWKLGQPDTQRGLALDAAGGAPRRRTWGGGVHAALVGVPLLVLAALERQASSPDDLARAEAMARTVPGNPTSRYQLGRELAVHGQLADAVPELRAALDYQPDLAAAHEELASVLMRLSFESLAAGRLDETIERRREAAELQPDSAKIANDLGVAYARANRLTDAEVAFRRALVLDPAHVDARANLAHAARLLGH